MHSIVRELSQPGEKAVSVRFSKPALDLAKRYKMNVNAIARLAVAKEILKRSQEEEEEIKISKG